MVVRRWFAALATAIGIVVTQPAIGMNQSALQEAMISVSFKICAGETRCGEMVMKIAVMPRGWAMDGNQAFGDVMLPWTASCSDGSYRSKFNEIAYAGTCNLSGAEHRLCFQMDSTTGDGKETLRMTQCLSFDFDSCEMDFKGQLSTSLTPSGRLVVYPLTSRETYSCKRPL